jgi:hypothetical protein
VRWPHIGTGAAGSSRPMIWSELGPNSNSKKLRTTS